MERDDISEWMVDQGSEGAFLADGFEDAFVGCVDIFGADGVMAVYDEEKCIEILMTDNDWTAEDAIERFEHDVLAGRSNTKSPVFIKFHPDQVL
jgi:hypothetical protein